MSKTVSSISSALAIMALKKSLEEGKEITIPSLGIKFVMKDGKVIQIPVENKEK